MFCRFITLNSMKTTNEKRSFSPASSIPILESSLGAYWISAGYVAATDFRKTSTPLDRG